ARLGSASGPGAGRRLASFGRRGARLIFDVAAGERQRGDQEESETGADHVGRVHVELLAPGPGHLKTGRVEPRSSWHGCSRAARSSTGPRTNSAAPNLAEAWRKVTREGSRRRLRITLECALGGPGREAVRTMPVSPFARSWP